MELGRRLNLRVEIPGRRTAAAADPAPVPSLGVNGRVLTAAAVATALAITACGSSSATPNPTPNPTATPTARHGPAPAQAHPQAVQPAAGAHASASSGGSEIVGDASAHARHWLRSSASSGA
ncbi:MAG: hypothetical protein ACR2NR_04345 [Solirubrobacteraceae bacterium]